MAEASIMIVAGEASGDQHGAALVRALQRARAGVRCWGAGGPAMRAESFETVVRAEQLEGSGLTEVVWAIPRLLRLLRRLARAAAERRPNVIVLIDLPDFNLRLAARLRSLGIPVVYYISPQVWAWRPGRVKQIKALVTQMLCILPFEVGFYQRHGVSAQFVGHPLCEELPHNPNREHARTRLGITAAQQPVIAFLPGSRPREIRRHLSVMLHSLKLLKRRFPDAIGIIPVASTIKKDRVERAVRRARVSAMVLEEQATEALAASDVAVVCSGTATLQTALLGRPLVVIYKVSWLTYLILKRLVRVSYISLVNLIVGRRLVAELIQSACTPARIDDEVRLFLEDPLLRIRLHQELAELRKGLGRADTAATVAGVVLNYMPDRRRTTQPRPGTMPPVRAVGGPEDP